MEAFDRIMHRGGTVALEQAASFFMKNDPVHHALQSITEKLRELEIPYAVVGGMALVAHGYDRTTTDVDILLTSTGHRVVKEQLDGLGYVPPFAHSKNLRDTQTGVRIEFLIAGQYPGDGKPKPVAFPDPATASVEIGGIRYLKLEKLIELKLASGLSAPTRLRDLADVQELIRHLKLPREMAEQLDPSVRGKYLEFWEAFQQNPDEPE